MRGRVRQSGGRVLACAVVTVLAAACDAAQAGDVQPLPPLERPSAETRAGLPEVAGTWRFAGWEINPGDTARINADSSILVRPGDLVVRVQRLDSLSGAYVRDSVPFPFTGEVRRDGVVSVVVSGADGLGIFLAGRMVRDTFWLELTSLPSAAAWPRGTRAALVRTPVRQTFRRFVGGRAIPIPVDSAALDSVRRADSLAVFRRDSAAAAAAAAGGVVPGRTPVGPAPLPGAPGTVPPAGQPPVTGTQPPARPQPRPTPPAQRPRPEPQRPVPAPQEPTYEPVPVPEPTPLPPANPAPRETIRIPTPPPLRQQ